MLFVFVGIALLRGPVGLAMIRAASPTSARRAGHGPRGRADPEQPFGSFVLIAVPMFIFRGKRDELRHLQRTPLRARHAIMGRFGRPRPRQRARECISPA